MQSRVTKVKLYSDWRWVAAEGQPSPGQCKWKPVKLPMHFWEKAPCICLEIPVMRKYETSRRQQCISLAMPKNASKPQEFTDCPCDLEEETANSELWTRTPELWCLLSDTRSTCKRQGWFLVLQVKSPCWCFCKRKGKLTGNRRHICMLWFSCHSPRLATKLLFPCFSHGSTGNREGDTMLMSHHATRDDSLTVGVHKALTQHKWQLFPQGSTLGGLW